MSLRSLAAAKLGGNSSKPVSGKYAEDYKGQLPFVLGSPDEDPHSADNRSVNSALCKVIRDGERCRRRARSGA
jgi:hypothetical protein